MNRKNEPWTIEDYKISIGTGKLPKECEIIFYDKDSKRTIESIIHWQDEEKKIPSPEITFYMDGSLKSTGMVTEGKVYQGISTEYFPGGELKTTAAHENGKNHGKYIAYCLNGNVRIEANYKNGFKDGVCKWYYPNGILHISEGSKEGVLHGHSWVYNPDGKIIQRKEYENGVQVGTEETVWGNGRTEMYYYRSGKMLWLSALKVNILRFIHNIFPPQEVAQYHKDGR